jgi:hypothetical protein
MNPVIMLNHHNHVSTVSSILYTITVIPQNLAIHHHQYSRAAYNTGTEHSTVN